VELKPGQREAQKKFNWVNDRINKDGYNTFEFRDYYNQPASMVGSWDQINPAKLQITEVNGTFQTLQDWAPLGEDFLFTRNAQLSEKLRGPGAKFKTGQGGKTPISRDPLEQLVPIQR
jgi:hypothetical protein